MHFRIILAAAAAALLVPVGAQAQTLGASEFSRDTLPANPDNARIETVRADLARAIGGWSGVRSCGDAQAARQRMRAAFDRWIGQQTMARPGKLLITYGWEASSWSFQNSTRGSWPNKRRVCKGSFGEARVYARFY